MTDHQLALLALPIIGIALRELRNSWLNWSIKRNIGAEARFVQELLDGRAQGREVPLPSWLDNYENDPAKLLRWCRILKALEQLEREQAEHGAGGYGLDDPDKDAP